MQKTLPKISKLCREPPGWIGIGLAFASLIIFYRVTRNYFAVKTEKSKKMQKMKK